MWRWVSVPHERRNPTSIYNSAGIAYTIMSISLFMTSVHTSHPVIYFDYCYFFLVDMLLTAVQQTVRVQSSWRCWQLVLCLSIDKGHTMLALAAQASLWEVLHHLCLRPILLVADEQWKRWQAACTFTHTHTVSFKAVCLPFLLLAPVITVLSGSWLHQTFSQCWSADVVL